MRLTSTLVIGAALLAACASPASRPVPKVPEKPVTTPANPCEAVYREGTDKGVYAALVTGSTMDDAITTALGNIANQRQASIRSEETNVFSSECSLPD